jgi:hypothetical protein
VIGEALAEVGEGDERLGRVWEWAEQQAHRGGANGDGGDGVFSGARKE